MPKNARINRSIRSHRMVSRKNAPRSTDVTSWEPRLDARIKDYSFVVWY
ncbi:hypothetical protein JXM67_05720 [candidate division WOR-3 bacterium]|nr:hypothetical protein [candidate division WOR-3 bacterium]